MTLARTIAGEGPPLLLLHAGIADARMWVPLSERLAARFRTIAPDLPSFGRTPPAAGPFAPVRDLVGLLDELDVERAAVVGASFGGWVAMDLATQVPTASPRSCSWRATRRATRPPRRGWRTATPRTRR